MEWRKRATAKIQELHSTNKGPQGRTKSVCFILDTIRYQGEGDITIAGNDITSIEVVRSSVRTQFDQNIVTHYGCQVCH